MFIFRESLSAGGGGLGSAGSVSQRIVKAGTSSVSAKTRTSSGSTASVPQWLVRAGRGLASTVSVPQWLVTSGAGSANAISVLHIGS